jgi:hypothetical protein
VRHTRRTRPNPITFDNRFEVTPEVRESIRVTKDRAKASILSPAKQRAIEQTTINSPHNFRVVIGGWRDDLRVPGALTLNVARNSLANLVSGDEETFKADRTSVFTAFTYLHRFGDRVLLDLSVAYGTRPDDSYFLEKDCAYFIRSVLGQSTSVPDVREVARTLAACRTAFAEARSALQGQGVTPIGASRTVLRYINTHVNSKMVREGYSSDSTQALADLFPLCELAPPSRPLFLPFDERRMERETLDPVPAKQPEILTKYGEQMNVRFRAFYNALVPALYGGVVEIL